MSDPAEVIDLPQDDKPETPRRRTRRRAPNPNQPKGPDGKFLPTTGGRKGSGSGKRSHHARTPRRQRDDLEAPIREMLGVVSTFWIGIEASRYAEHPTPLCGTILGAQAPAIAASLNAVAQDDDSVYRWLSAMMTGGGWGAVAFAVLPVANAVVSNHALPAMQAASARRAARRGLSPEVEPMFEEGDTFKQEENLGGIPAPDERDTWRPPNEIPPDGA